MALKPTSFPELFAQADQHADYWVTGTILEFTEGVVGEMERQGVTRTELARRLGATPAYVTKILRGKANFTLETMVRLALALDAQSHVQLAADAGQPALQQAVAGAVLWQASIRPRESGRYRCCQSDEFLDHLRGLDHGLVPSHRLVEELGQGVRLDHVPALPTLGLAG